MKMNPILPVWIVLIILIIAISLFAYRLYKKEAKTKSKIFSFLRVLLITILVFFLNLRLMKPTYTKDALLKNIDVLFVVDNTISMYAKDDNSKTRMNYVQKDCEYIMDYLDGGNFALIRFDNKSQILSPFTQDQRNINDALAVITYPDVYYASGSSLNVAYDDMKSLLESSNKKENRMTIIFFISDGEITDGSSLISFKELSKYIDGGAVLGYGSEEGGKMSVGTYYEYFLTDPTTGEDAISKIDKDTLSSISLDLDVPTFFMHARPSLEPLLKRIVNESSSYIGSTNAIDYDDIYYYFAYPLIALLGLELYLFFRKGKI